LRGLLPFDELWENVQPFLQGSPAALLDIALPFNGEHQSLRVILQRLPTREFAQVKAQLHLADWLASAKQSQTPTLFLSGHTKTVEKHLQKFPKACEFRRKARDVSSKTEFSGCELRQGPEILKHC
jgi:CRISPR-associated endonuclease/helicase Cas3